MWEQSLHNTDTDLFDMTWKSYIKCACYYEQVKGKNINYFAN